MKNIYCVGYYLDGGYEESVVLAEDEEETEIVLKKQKNILEERSFFVSYCRQVDQTKSNVILTRYQ
jgi:hypothetical protein